jgi:hypothetical protein
MALRQAVGGFAPDFASLSALAAAAALAGPAAGRWTA